MASTVLLNRMIQVCQKPALNWVFIVVCAVGFPLLVYPPLALDILCWALFASAYNILLGVTGMLSFGQAAFWGVGAYTYGYLSIHFGLSFPLAVFVGGIAGLIMAIPIGVLAVRTSGIVFAMVTLALAQIIYYLANDWSSVTGGDDGMVGIPINLWHGMSAMGPAVYYLSLPFIMLGLYCCRRIVRSPFGEVLASIRDNPAKSMALGYPVARYRAIAFALVGGLSGIAGSIAAANNGVASLVDLHWTTSGLVVVICVVGGLRTTWGGVIGAALILYMEHLLTTLNFTGTDMITGLVLLFITLMFRKGVVGSLPGWGRSTGRSAMVAPAGNNGSGPDIQPVPAESGEGRASDGVVRPGSKANGQDESMESDACLVCREVSVAFRGFQALRDVNFEVPRGKVNIIIGPNGAGKSTLFNVLTGFVKPDSGSIYIGGRNIVGSPPHRIAKFGVARSFQVSSLYASRTAISHVQLALQCRYGEGYRFWSSPRQFDRWRSEALELLGRVGLSGYENVTASRLPYGSRRALEIAMALALEPEIMLLDEPTSGMASEDIASFIELVRSVGRHCSMVLIEHNMSVVSELADNVIVLQAGHVIASGSYQSVREDPRVVEAYLGAAKNA